MDSDLHFVLPSKRVVDIRAVPADFSSLLSSEEIILNCAVSVEVFAGIDPTPNAMIDGTVAIVGKTVIQRIRQGLPGVIYTLIFQADTSDGNLYTLTAEQAVLRDGIPLEPIYVPMVVTSRPYSIYVYEGIEASSDLNSGEFLTVGVEGIDPSAELMSGTLREILQQYSYTEGIDPSASIVDGVLDVVLLQYNYTEGVDASTVLVTGVLRVVLIQYTNWPAEGADCSAELISGTLI